MAFPNMTLRVDVNSPGGVSELFAEALGIPDNGPNTFSIPFVGAGINPTFIDPNWMEFWADMNGAQGTVPGVLGVEFVSIDPTKTMLTMNFSQAAPGVGTARLVCRLVHTEVR